MFIRMFYRFQKFPGSCTSSRHDEFAVKEVWEEEEEEEEEEDSCTNIVRIH